MRRFWRAFLRDRPKTDNDTLESLEPERSLVRSSLATSENHTIPQYVDLSDMPNPDSFHFLSEDLDFVNWLVHQRLRHQQEYNLCAFCASLDLPNEVLHDPSLTKRKAILEETSGPHCRAYARVKRDADKNIVSLLPQKLEHTGYNEIDSRKAQTCPLCESIRQLVLEIIQRRYGAGIRAAKNVKSSHLRIATISRIKSTCEKETVVLYVQVNNGSWYIEIPILLLSRFDASSSAARVASSEGQSLTSAPAGIRNVPSSTVNWNLVMTWLHNLPIPNRAKDLQYLEGFKLIDVRANCVVASPVNPRFAALSYVWGNSKQYLLRGKDVKMLEKEGSLTRISKKISLVVKDAMESCSKLNIPYLWVDSLCIVQDSPQIKYRQIVGMDIIYSAAYVTLVDGQGRNADSGLARVSIPNNRTTARMELGGFNYAVVQSPHSALDYAPWVSRGWTFQELLLSTRLLVFLDTTTMFCHSFRTSTEYVYYGGSQSLPIESFGRMGKTIKAFQGLMVQNVSTSELRRNDIVEAYYHHHLRLINNYVARELSRDDDIEFAFAGVLNKERKLLGECRHGLPISILARALLWLDPNSSISNRRPCFPSWSWTGWKFSGLLQDSIRGKIDLLSLIYIWGFDTTGELVRLLGDRTEADEGFCQKSDDCRYTWDHLQRIQPIQEKPVLPPLLKLGLPLSQYLIFWTSCARIAVDKESSTQGESYPIYYGIMIEGTSADEEIGGIDLPIERRANQPKYLEFVAIAETQDFIQTIAVETIEGISYRVGVPIQPIRRTKWLACQREEKLIILG